MFGGGFGGMPGMAGMGRPKKTDNTRFYKLLDCPSSASADELKKAFRKAAIKHHPDKGGDPEKFKEISAAYEVLADPEKRAVYDEYGEEAVKEGMGGGGGGFGGGNPMDIFESLFGGGGFGGGGRSRGGKQKGEDVQHVLKVSLEELYNGTTKKLSLDKNVLCGKCEGSGSKSGAASRCPGCQGAGVRIYARQIAPGMVQQMQAHCQDCGGEGKVISEKDRCTACRGNKTVREKKILEVAIERGMSHGQRIVFRGEAHEAPDTVPGDIVFVLQQKEHEVLKRKGPDLFFEKTLTLAEALCGFKFAVPHLDGRLLLVTSNEGDIVKPGAYKAVYDEGMPTWQRPTDRGRLFIHFDVAFPAPGDLSDRETAALLTLLPPRPPLEVDVSACQEVSVSDVDMETEMQRQRQNAQDEEEDDPRGRVQCAQQ